MGTKSDTCEGEVWWKAPWSSRFGPWLQECAEIHAVVTIFGQSLFQTSKRIRQGDKQALRIHTTVQVDLQNALINGYVNLEASTLAFYPAFGTAVAACRFGCELAQYIPTS